MPFAHIEIAATASYDPAAMIRLWSEDDEGIGGQSVTFQPGVLNETNAPPESWGRYTWRVWWEPPFKYRDEVTRPGIPTDVAIVRQNARMMYVACDRTLYTNEAVAADGRWEVVPAPIGIVELPSLENRSQVFPLIRPPLPETAWQFATVGEGEEYDGRVTRRVRVTRRIQELPAGEPPHPGYVPLVDEYECIVDDERQIVLRLSAISKGVPIAVVVADDVRVDAPIPSDIFHFIPPDGARLIHVERSDR